MQTMQPPWSEDSFPKAAQAVRVAGRTRRLRSPAKCEHLRPQPASVWAQAGCGRGLFPAPTVTEVEVTEGRAPRRVHLARAEPRVHESVSPGHRARQTEASAGFAREGPTATGLHRPLSREAAASRLRGPAPVSVRAVFPSYDKRHRRHRRREKCLSLGGETR